MGVAGILLLLVATAAGSGRAGLPVEGLLGLPLLALLPARRLWARMALFVAASILTALALLAVVDRALGAAYGRSFNPNTDLSLFQPGLDLVSRSAGLPGAIVAVAGLAAILAVAGAVWWAMIAWASHGWTRRGMLALVAACIGSALVAPTASLAIGLSGRVAQWNAFSAGMADYRSALAAEPGHVDAPLALLDGRDVVFVFIESYGRASFDNPLYAPTHKVTLAAMQAALQAQGLSTRSGWLSAPVAGGQSWLAHATLAAGLRMGDPQRYAMFLASARRTLFDDARDAGYGTFAFMPAITMPWPEGRRIGFDHVFAAGDLGYRGKPFNWVTMPDQFTLAAAETVLAGVEQPTFAQIVLISSHAPWTPIPPILPADALGDGTVFDAAALAGDSPDIVWRDRDRVRDQYRLALDYSLRVALDFAGRKAAEGALVMLLGDHPPAQFVSGIASADVPAHLIGREEAIAPLAALGWSTGLVPAAQMPSLPMEAFRDSFVHATSRTLGE